MTEGIVISLEILVIGIGNRGSKSDLASVKEQRVDGSSVLNSNTVRCTLVAGKPGSWKKLSNSRLKMPQ